MRKPCSLFRWLWSGLAAMLVMFGASVSCAQDGFLDPEVAFKLAARALDDRTVEVVFSAAPGYYLYREQFRFSAEGATLGEPVMPPGKAKFDETFQKTVETYRGELRIKVPVVEAGARFTLLVTNQGCADKGLCYPPQERAIDVGLAGFGGNGSATLVSPGAARAGATASSQDNASASRADRVGLSNLVETLGSRRLWQVVGIFLTVGALLSFTMLFVAPSTVFAAIKASQPAGEPRTISLVRVTSFSLGMTLVLTLLGVVASAAGEVVEHMMQRSWIVVVVAAVLATVALSMIGFFALPQPTASTRRLSNLAQRSPPAGVVRLIALGAGSTLVALPGLAAPLLALLLGLNRVGAMALAGPAFFALGAGMSVCWYLSATPARLLGPSRLAWTERGRQVAGVMLLGAAVWTAASIVPWP